MSFYDEKYFCRHRASYFYILCVVGFVVVAMCFYAITVFAAPLFAPGETLDPNCSPTNPDCTVTSLVDTDTHLGNANLTLSAARTLTLNGNALTLDGVADIVFSNAGALAIGAGLTVSGSSTLTGGVTTEGDITLSTGGGSLFSTGGGLTFQAAGTDTTSSVQIGAGGAGSTTPDLFGLDVKSSASDPTGFNGAMYYSESSSKFRCFEASGWKDCDTTGGTLTLQSAYNAGATITTAGSVSIALTLTSGNFTASGAGSVLLTPTGASSFTSGGALTLTGGASSVWSTSSGTLTITSATSNALTLDSGTTGTVNLGTGNNAKTVNIGTGTAGNAINIGTNNTVADTISIGSALDTFSLSSTGLNVTTAGALTVGGLGIEFTESDTNPACASGNFSIYADTSEGKLKKCQNGTASDLDTTGGGGSAADLQHAALYDTNEEMTPVTAVEVVLGTVSVTPGTATGDVYVTGQADTYSNSALDQPVTLSIETGALCLGSVVGNATVTYTITSGASAGNDRGSLIVSGVAIDPGAGAQAYSLCASTSAGLSQVLNWRIEALVIDTGADFAEMYTTRDVSLGAGDVVSADYSLKTGVKKSARKNDPTMMGVVSTQPGKVIGDVDKDGVGAVPVALNGRVPVKVSAINGAIKPGDFLTSSTIPGVAMRADGAGFVVGQAITSFDGVGVGTVLMFIKNMYMVAGE